MSTDSYRFGPFIVDGGSYRLLRSETAIAVSPKALDLLLMFAGRPAALFTKDEILDALWPDVAVTDNALTQVISELRQALGDNPASPEFIETVPRRGYRFIATVEKRAPGHPSPDASPSDPVTRTLADVFDVQDAIVRQLSTDLQITLTPAASARIQARETSNLEAYRASTEGRLKLETLDPAEIPGALADFERALNLDPRYALAHV